MYKIYNTFRNWLRTMQATGAQVPDDPLSKMSLKELADLPPWHECVTPNKPCKC